MLTQGSVLTVSSYATRTSPVLRGKWVLDNLLNSPPPPPPPDVPNLDESDDRDGDVDARATRSAPEGRHLRVLPSPDGPAWIRAGELRCGRRLTDRSTASSRSTRPARCRTGDSFTGPVELAEILKEGREPFARAITSKLMTYALGRGLERYDTRTVKLIASRLPAHNYRFSALVLEIVNSLPFQSRRAVPTGAATP